MTVPLSSRWEDFIERQVQAGRFSSAREVIEASLGLKEQCEAKLAALRATIEGSMAEGGKFSAEQVRHAIHSKADELRAKAG